MMEAAPLPSPEVMLSSGYNRYYERLRLPLWPSETSFPYIHQLLVPAPERVSCATPYGFPCVSPLLPREPVRLSSGSYPQNRHFSLPLTSKGSATPLLITRLPIGSLSLQPAGLLDPLNGPLSGNSALRVTPCASLMLHG